MIERNICETNGAAEFSLSA